jgi:hypothetical protein
MKQREPLEVIKQKEFLEFSINLTINSGFGQIWTKIADA